VWTLRHGEAGDALRAITKVHDGGAVGAPPYSR